MSCSITPFFVLLCILASGSVLCQYPVKVTRNVEVTAEEEKVRDKSGYEAIKEIHREMDDDHSGSIDRNESTGFMKEDMHMRGSERTRRENKFHGDDDAITVDDLWEAWFETDERNWSNERLIEWLINDVNLPTVAEIVKRRKLDGKVLPRFATQNPEYLTKELGIKSSVYRQKLRLNSLDVVLFGYKDNNNRMKDVLLGLLALLLTSLLVLFIRQKNRAQRTVNELSTKLTELKNMESEFDDVQKLLNDERSKRSNDDETVSQVEMQNLRIQLEEAERRLEANSNGSGTPLALQPLLRRTCENEMAFLEKQRQECFKEMKEAIEMVDRLQKKQGSVLSSLKLATGAASASDQVDSKIFSLKNRMEKIHGLTRETQERWMQIESLCGFPVFYVNETEHMNRTNASSGAYYSNHTGSTTSSGAGSAPNPPRPKISNSSAKAHSIAASTNLRFMEKNGSDKHSQDIDDDIERLDRQTRSFDEVPRRVEANIVFQSNGTSSPTTPEDTRSIQTTSSTATNGTSAESKKKRSIISKMFRKSTSKSSLNNNSGTKLVS